MAKQYFTNQFVGNVRPVLLEAKQHNELMVGYTHS